MVVMGTRGLLRGAQTLDLTVYGLIKVGFFYPCEQN